MDARADLWRRLVHVHLQMAALYEDGSRTQGLTPRQAQVLCLAAAGSPSLRDLADAAHTSPHNMTGLVDRLVDRGLIRRRADRCDRRVVRIQTTAQGRMAVEGFHRAMEAPLQDLVVAEPDQAAAILAALGDALDDLLA